MEGSTGKGWKPSGTKGPKDQRVRRRTHLSVVLGITFCVIGGAVMASSFVLGWSVTPQGDASIWELVDRGGVYLVALLVPLSGALSAAMSALDVLAEKGRKRFKGPSALGSLAAGLLGTISVAIVAVGINQDIADGAATSFGPALFMSVFGGILAVSGGMILTIDYLEARSRRGRFVASGGSEELKRALKPSGGKKDARSSGTSIQSKGTFSEDREVFEAPRSTGLECPNCYSPVQPNWSICPICGQELLSS